MHANKLLVQIINKILSLIYIPTIILSIYFKTAPLFSDLTLCNLTKLYIKIEQNKQ